MLFRLLLPLMLLSFRFHYAAGFFHAFFFRFDALPCRHFLLAVTATRHATPLR